MRRIAILAEGAFTWRTAKTATGVIRYGKDTVVAIIDSTKAGMDVPEALGGASFGHGIPIVRDINEALKYQPDSLLFDSVTLDPTKIARLIFLPILGISLQMARLLPLCRPSRHTDRA